jgi:hypothetical protein
LAMSRPIVLTVCINSSSESWELYQPPLPWHSRAGGGAVHSINSDLTRRSKRHRYSITSSARPSNGSGNVMPRALAVSRFRNISLSWPAGLQVGGFLAIENAASVNAS